MRTGGLLGGEIEYNLLFKPICLLLALCMSMEGKYPPEFILLPTELELDRAIIDNTYR